MGEHGRADLSSPSLGAPKRLSRRSYMSFWIGADRTQIDPTKFVSVRRLCACDSLTAATASLQEGTHGLLPDAENMQLLQPDSFPDGVPLQHGICWLTVRSYTRKPDIGKLVNGCERAYK